MSSEKMGDTFRAKRPKGQELLTCCDHPAKRGESTENRQLCSFVFVGAKYLTTNQRDIKLFSYWMQFFQQEEDLTLGH